jgi:hypothetical protein
MESEGLSEEATAKSLGGIEILSCAALHNDQPLLQRKIMIFMRLADISRR